MEPTSPRSGGGLRPKESRPARLPDGPPGLAALLDAERSALREYHDRLNTLTQATLASEARTFALEDARRLQSDGRRQARGYRDRMRTREHDRRLLVADAKAMAIAAAAEAEAADARVRVALGRLDEVRRLVDSIVIDDRRPIDALRRPSDLPSRAALFHTVPAFIADVPCRAIGDPRLQDLVGSSLGDRWTLEERARPWVTTRWRAAWAREGDAPSGEVYAVEHAARPHAARRVWLLGVVPESSAALRAFEPLLGYQAERNSLAALAATIDALA